MNKKTKLASLALILFVLLFSISAISASENTTDQSDDVQVSNIEKLSVSNEIEVTSLDTSASDSNQEISEISSDTNINNDYKSSSDNQTGDYIKKTSVSVKSNEIPLAVSNDEAVLGATITPDGTRLQDITNAINSASTGDVIDLGGLTYSGGNPVLHRGYFDNKIISIINGIIDGGNVNSEGNMFSSTTFINVTFINFKSVNPNGVENSGDCFQFYNSTLYNCKFDNCTGQMHILRFVSHWSEPSFTGSLLYSNFTNCHVLYDGRLQDNGQMIHLYGNALVDHCNFINTSSNHHAGAICMDPAGAKVTNSYFENCSGWIGGAIYVHGHNHAGFYELDSLLENCTFINCSATEFGGAIATNYGGLNITNCYFSGNTAQKGGGIMIGGIDYPLALRGDNLHGHNIKIEDCYFYDNVADEGGAIHVSGDNDTVINCIFDDNFAENGKGAAIFVEGTNATVINSQFTNHKSDEGTVYINGSLATVIASTFEDNTATHGGAGVYIQGDNSFIDRCIFENNNASRHGGAIHTLGSHATITNSEFYSNNAIPSILENPDYGLGGAIFIEGDHNWVSNSTFDYNTARNGSAIYTKGHDFHVENDEFIENQAWSYFLFTEAQPPEAYWSEDLEVVLNVTLIAGDNIINAIYNNAGIGDIYFHNVTYELSDSSITGSKYRTTTDGEIHPAPSVEESLGGTIIYQDAREDNQKIALDIVLDGQTVFSDHELITNLYGNVLLPITKQNLSDGQFHPGVYNVTASHPEDMLYTAIENSTTFVILPHVDLSVTKTSDKDVYILYEPATFTIRVTGVGTNATNVVVKDILPSSFKYISSSATKGSYDKDTNEWYIGFLPHLASETLTLTVNTTALGTFDNVVNVTSAERDWNLSNNVDNKTVHVDIYYTKEANTTQTSAGEYIEYYLRVFNKGNTLYTETVQVRDILPEGLRFTGEYEVVGADVIRFTNYGDEQIWYLTNISAGTRAKVTIKVQALRDGIWNNTLRVWDLPPVEKSVNVSSNADLRVLKEVSVLKTNKGDIISWNISVKNDGPSMAMDAYVDDILPDGVVFYSFTQPTKGNYNRDTGRWTIGNMAVGDTEYLIINTRVTASNTNITNEAVVNSSTPDPNPNNNYDNATTEVTPEGDVGIEKAVSAQSSNHGQVIYWTIKVTNYGPDRATGVYVIDTLPDGLDFLNQSATKGSYSPASGRWTVGNMEKDEVQTLTIYTRVVTLNTIINNVAVVNSSSVDSNPDNNEAENFTVVGPVADLELIKEVDNDSVVKGDVVTWTITVINHGPNDALDVYVEDILPEGLIFIDASSRNYNSNTGIWTIGHLSENDSASIKIRTRVNASNAIIENYAVVNSSTYDPNLNNNDDDEDITVKTEADVGVIKLVSNQTAHFGDKVTWTIIVTNYGPNTAENVVLTDFIPKGLIVDGTPSRSQGHVYVDPETGIGIWEIGNLENGKSVTCEFDSTINTTGNTLRNVVNVTTTSHDPDLSNNVAYNITVIPEECDVAVLKKVDNLTPNKYDIVTWTITVVNHGPNVAKNVIVNEVLPEGLEYISNTVPTAGSYQHTRNMWILDDVEVNARYTLNITTRVIDTGLITNEVNVTTSTYDTNLENNYANETIDVPAIADLEVIKVVSNSTPNYGDLVNWTITVKNNGPNNARNVYVIDKLPQGLIYVSDSTYGEDYNPISGRWTIGTLLHFDSISLTITTRVDVTNATIRNIATVYSTTPDSNESNNQDNDTIDVPPAADLAIDKTVNDHGPRKGDNITWIITVVNKGPDTAVNAVATDVLPEGLIFVSSNGNGSYDVTTDTWTIGDLANGETAVLNIVTTVNVTLTVITNTVNVTSDTPDPDETNNEDNSTIDIGHEADLGIVKEVSNSNPKYGDEITWTITVTNNGPDNAVEVYVTDKLPNGLVWIEDNGNGTYDHTTGIWTIGTLNNHSHISLVITTLVNVTNTNITNVAVVDADTHDPYPGNNTDNDTITVNSLADLYIVKSVNDTAIFGDLILWQIGVMNFGPDTAIDAYVEDVLPEGLIFTEYGATKGAYDYETGIWTIGNLIPGEMHILQIWTIVNITEGNITNFAVVNSSTEDPNPYNNEDNDTVIIKDIADLEITKLVSNKNPRFNETITWTIIVKNNGPSDAKDVTVTDKLPSGLIYVTDDSQGAYDKDSGIWTIGDLANGDEKQLVITTIVNITNTTITNVAVVNSTTPDNNESNNKANNTTDVDPEADLEIVKRVSSNTTKIGDNIVWTVIVTNKGPDAAVNVYVRDELPKELVYVSHTTTKGIFDQNGPVWYINSLAKGESQTLTITTLVNITNTTLTNIVNVTSDTYDPNETNNNASNNTTVAPKSQLVVVKEVSDKNPSFNDTITWTITVTNNGPDVSVETIVTDKLPAGLIFVESDGNYDSNTGIWTVGDLANGESKSLVITTIVNITNATIENVATPSSNTSTNNTPGNNTTDVDPVADLEVIKTVSANVTRTGQIITWTITVTNNGPDTAVNAKATDKLPQGLIYISDDSNGAYNPVSGIWTIGDLTNGAQAVLNIRTQVNITNKTIRNVVNVTSDTPDNNKTNNEDNNTTDIIPEADIEVIKTVSNSTPNKGDIVVWTLNITNNGPDNSTNIVVVDQIPDGLVFIDNNNDPVVDKAVRIVIPKLNVGESLILYVKTLVNASDVNLTNEVIAASLDVYDPNTENNKDNETVEVNPNADLEIIKLVSSTTAKKGDTVTWTITVTNNGPDKAVNVRVNDKLPAGLTYISHSADIGLYDPVNGIWLIGDLANGEFKSLIITTQVAISNGNITNIAVVTSDTPDDNNTNNEANNTTEVNDAADLEVIKTVSNSNPHKGDVIIWTVTVKNNGPSDAKDVIVTDKLPAGLVFAGSDGTYNPVTGIWNIGNLANGASAVLNIQTLVNITNRNITNVAVVNSTTPDPYEPNNEGNNTTDVAPEADLKVIKTVSNSTPNKGDVITWTVVVTNNGPDDAKDVVVTDKLPAGLIFISANGNYNKDTGIWTVGDLANGASASLIITTQVDITNANITNVAVVNSSTYDPNKTNNEGNNTTDVPPEADLGVVKVVSNSNPHKGEIITWTITVTNYGPDKATNVAVTDKLPAGLTFISANGDYDKDSGIWNVGDLANGASKSLIITTLVEITNATIRNVANVTSDVYDPNKTNDEGNNTTDVAPEADLEIIKTVSNSTPNKGDIITWTLTVINHGPDSALNVVITDEIPEGLSIILYGNRLASRNITVEIPEIKAGESHVFSFETLVEISNKTITNVAVVNSTTYDPNKHNNEGNNTTDVAPEADLSVIKTVSNSNPHKGDIITWTVVVTNNGPDDAKDVVVTDKLPAGLIFISANGNYNKDTGIWTVGNLANGASASLIITTQVDITNANITNVAVVNSSTYDPNKTNNEGNNTTDVPPEADLGVVKVVSNSNPHKGETITWTITVTNYGPDKATNVAVTDKLPAGLTFISANGNYNKNTGVWTVGDLANGESKSLTITTLVEITNATIRNVANVTSDIYDPNKTNDEGNNTTDVAPEADLNIVKLVSDKNTAKGNVITWTIIVTNNGPDAARNVYVTDALPTGLVYKNHTVTKGLFDSNSLVWFISSLGNGESQTLTIDTLVSASNTTLVNNVNVTNDVYDPNETNNNANNTTVVEKEDVADLEVIKVVNNTTPHKGDIVSWTVTVTNNGPNGAKDVVVTDKLPAGLTFISANGNYDKDTGIWTVGDLANGESKSLIITTQVAITNANITNIAVASSSTYDPNETNNKDNDTTEVDPEADLQVIKTVSNPTPYNGETITWTVVVTNLGPDTAKDVKVQEELPEGLKLLKAKGTKGSYDNGVWTIGDLNNGEIVTLVLTTKVTASDVEIENVVVVNSSTYDPKTSNNRDEEVTNPQPSADLELIKVADKTKVKVGDKIVWTITVVNHGPDKAINVRVTDRTTGDLEFISAKTSTGEFDIEDGIWTIGDLEVGESAVLQLTFKALSDTDAYNYAVVESDTHDPNKDNNYDSSHVGVVGPDEPNNPGDVPVSNDTPQTSTMYATGNPIAMVILALLSVVGVTLRRKD